MSNQQLNKSIGLFSGVVMALSIVIGAGIATLPGLVYKTSGAWAIWVWLLDGILIIPLLVVFVILGRKWPSAGGITAYIANAWPWSRAGCAYVLIGAFSLGIPAIALTGAGYLTDTLGVAPTRLNITLSAVAILCIPYFLNFLGGKIALSIQSAVVTMMIIALFGVAYLPETSLSGLDMTAGAPSIMSLWTGMGLAFFAYTGFEMLSFMTEEFKNPKRDLPIVTGISVVLVLVLYFGIALSVQTFVPYENDILQFAPLNSVIRAAFPTISNIDFILSVVVILMTIVNLTGAIWAASRLIFDISREGKLYSKLAILSGQGVPRGAVVFAAILMGGSLALYCFAIIELDEMLTLAGQNFFLLYMITMAAFVRLANTLVLKLTGVFAVAVCFLFATVYGYGLLYALILFCLPYLFIRHMKRVPST